ncbi:MAG: hypothetical protein IH933_03825 [Euryarchaeota archaeon]|nr:hypothetical protein [Euryarchaeota archaeon]
MVGVLAIAKKAATFGYKRYGVPGAVASVAVVLGGYYLKKTLSGSKNDSNQN